VSIVAPFLLAALMWAGSLVVAWIAAEHLVTRHIRRLGRAIRAFASGSPRRGRPRHGRRARRDPRGGPGLLRMTDTILHDEAELEDTVHQREVLLREVHHRVKNNLQLIASIMNMQMRRARSPETRALMKGLQDRVMSLATVHKELYQTSGLTDVRADELLGDLVRQIVGMASAPGRTFRIDTDLAAIPLAPDQAVPLSLLLTEGLTNAIKYATPAEGEPSPRISVAFAASPEGPRRARHPQRRRPRGHALRPRGRAWAASSSAPSPPSSAARCAPSSRMASSPCAWASSCPPCARPRRGRRLTGAGAPEPAPPRLVDGHHGQVPMQHAAGPARDRAATQILITASEAFPAFEREVLRARAEIWASFRIFDPSTRLRSPEARAVGETWWDLVVHTLRRGVAIHLTLADFDPVGRPFAPPRHLGLAAPALGRGRGGGAGGGAPARPRGDAPRDRGAARPRADLARGGGGAGPRRARAQRPRARGPRGRAARPAGLAAFLHARADGTLRPRRWRPPHSTPRPTTRSSPSSTAAAFTSAGSTSTTGAGTPPTTTARARKPGRTSSSCSKAPSPSRPRRISKASSP
jgi:two-component sensor histidine kinase